MLGPAWQQHCDHFEAILVCQDRHKVKIQTRGELKQMITMCFGNALHVGESLFLHNLCPKGNPKLAVFLEHANQKTLKNKLVCHTGKCVVQSCFRNGSKNETMQEPKE